MPGAIRVAFPEPAHAGPREVNGFGAERLGALRPRDVKPPNHSARQGDGQAASHAAVSAPASWQSRQRGSTPAGWPSAGGARGLTGGELEATARWGDDVRPRQCSLCVDATACNRRQARAGQQEFPLSALSSGQWRSGRCSNASTTLTTTSADVSPAVGAGARRSGGLSNGGSQPGTSGSVTRTASSAV